MFVFLKEIYPPKLADFAYVTDGACTTDEIVFTELVVCKVSENVQKLQTDIPIPISYIFHAPLHIKIFQLTTQLMTSNFLFMIRFLACLLFLGFSCYLIKHRARVP